MEVAEYRSWHKQYTMSLHGEESNEQDAICELYATADSFIYASYHRRAKGSIHAA